MNEPYRRWVYLGIASLALSGLYSVALVLLRSPGLFELIDKNLFRTALVIHVNLSVLVWLLSSIAALWFYRAYTKHSYFINYINYLAWLGVVLMAISPMIASSNPILNNYVPMLDNWCFVLGLVLFALAIIFVSIIALFVNYNQVSSLLKSANIASVLIIIIATFSFSLSSFSLEKVQYQMDLHFYYEMFFWSGGHILQFVFVEGVMIVWILLLEHILGKKLYYQSMYRFLLVLNMLLTLPVFYAHFAYSIDSVEFIEFFTLQMKYCGGVAPSLMLLGLLSEYRFMPTSAAKNCLIASACLFFLGGGIGILISGINVTIPAHYHGSIVGISIAFMGFSYMALGINKDFYQPYVYAFGQIIHITGLAISGGYGVMRKLPGQELSYNAKIMMGLMGFGGLVAIVGGLMFVYICGKKLLNNFEVIR